MQSRLPNASNSTSVSAKAILQFHKLEIRTTSERIMEQFFNLLKEFQGIYETQKFSNICLVLSLNYWAVFESPV